MIHKTYDPEVDAFYITCKRGKATRTEDKKDYLVDYDAKGKILGYEILNYSMVAEKLGSIDGISLVPPYDATILYRATNSHKLVSEITGSPVASAISDSKKTKDQVKEFLNV
ncbi:MAG: DUF2283 domain-containing protein [Minisyncoccia bacterium]|jgi:uncharacterized protein YuzE